MAALEDPVWGCEGDQNAAASSCCWASIHSCGGGTEAQLILVSYKGLLVTEWLLAPRLSPGKPEHTMQS